MLSSILNQKILFSLALIILILAGCQAAATPTSLNPPANTSLPADAPTEMKPSSTPTHAENRPAEATPVTQVIVYLVALEDQGKSGTPVGCGDSLVPVPMQVDPSPDPLMVALQVLFSLQQGQVGQSGLYNATGEAELEVVNATVGTDGAATVEIIGNMRVGGVCDEPRFTGQIESTVLASPRVQSAQITINGTPLDQIFSQK